MNDNLTERFQNLSDGELIARVNHGEYELLQVVIRRYIPLIRKYAEKLSSGGFDFDDLVQEGIIALYSAVKGYDGEKASFFTFASVCVRRAMAGEIKNATRKNRIPDKLILPFDDVEITDLNSPEKIFFEKEDFKSLADTIRIGLSPLEYKVLCAFLSGKNYSDISHELEISVKSVDNSLKRIRAKLKEK